MSDYGRPEDALTLRELQLCPYGTKVVRISGQVFRKVPSAEDGIVRLLTSSQTGAWWDGETEVSSDELRQGGPWWPYLPVRDVSDDEPCALIDRDGDFWEGSDERNHSGAALYRHDGMRRTLADVDRQYGPVRKLYERP